LSEGRHLADLLGSGMRIEEGAARLQIRGITADSRAVEPGFLFACLPGTRTDGARFVPDAVARGAVAVLAKRGAVAVPPGIALIEENEPRRRLALIASRFYPGQPETVVAVTGTNGKTSVADFTRQIWTALGAVSASIGTLGVVAPDGKVHGGLTTPDPVALHRTLSDLAREGVTHLAMEASSHGLDQYRLDGVALKAGAFTNLGRDHLDYHPTLEAYLAAKLRLFGTLLPKGATAVIDADTPTAPTVIARAKAAGLAVFTVGREGEGIRLISVERDGFAQRLALDLAGRRHEVRLPLAGHFQVSNALVAAGLAVGSGSAAEPVLAALERLRGVPGRLELVGEKGGAGRDRALVFVDYAHKPEALANVLKALRPFTRGRLVVVFGAGGDRDQGKRPLMGRAAAEFADRVVVTDDNPRSEEPAAIRAAILAAAPGALEIADRAEAIRAAIEDLQPGDTLVVAGKGHETGQTIGDRTVPFSDHEVIARALGNV